MESTINRKEYRRNVYSNNYERVPREKEKNSNSQNLFLNKVVNAMLIFLSILLLKLFNFNEEFNLIKDKFNSGIPYEVLKENVAMKINEFNNEKNNVNIVEKSEDNIEKTNLEISLEEMNTKSGENEYITAVEGVNQLLDDSKIIKENYEIISPLNGVVTSKFGCRESDSPIVSSYHAGLDIAANTGTIITSAHLGKVIQAGDNGTYGKCVMIESGDLVTLYAHCSEVLVKVGDTVNVGEKIAKVGMTGNATGPHLHFEIRYQGRFINPEDVI